MNMDYFETRSAGDQHGAGLDAVEKAMEPEPVPTLEEVAHAFRNLSTEESNKIIDRYERITGTHVEECGSCNGTGKTSEEVEATDERGFGCLTDITEECLDCSGIGMTAREVK